MPGKQCFKVLVTQHFLSGIDLFMLIGATE